MDKAMIRIINHDLISRLLTADENNLMYHIVKDSPVWEDVWKTNMDPDISFHPDVYVQTDKTLIEYHKALLWISYVTDNMKEYECKVK